MRNHKIRNKMTARKKNKKYISIFLKLPKPCFGNTAFAG